MTGYGLIHLLGVVKGFGWAEVAELSEPISAPMAWVWAVAAVLVVTAGGLLAARVRWWWTVALVGAAVSQVAIAASWGDAEFGTVANAVLVVAALHGLLAARPVPAARDVRRPGAHGRAHVSGCRATIHALVGARLAWSIPRSPRSTEATTPASPPSHPRR